MGTGLHADEEVRARGLNFVYQEPESQLEDLRGGGSAASTAQLPGPGESGQVHGLRYSKCLEVTATARPGRDRPTQRL